MTSTGTGESTPAWFHNERANALPESKGDKKLRVDLFGMLKMEGVNKTTTDIANQFLIAAATDDVEKSSNARKTAKLPGRVAVKVAGEFEEGETIFKYAFLNLNSLAKRLHVTAEEIKRQEKQGTLDVFIKEKIQESVDKQAHITEILDGVRQGKDVFGQKGEVSESDDSEEADESEGAYDDDFMTTSPEKPEVASERQKANRNRKALSNFIEKHFANDEYLTTHLEGFLNKPDKGYLQYLVKKLWWDTGAVGEELGVQPEKRALTSVSAGKLDELGLTTFVGKAASRPGNAGSEVTTRLRLVGGDRADRYAIGVDGFVYAEKPEPQSRNEVALELGNDLWVLANKNSLKRLGLTDAQISGSAEDLAGAVREKKEQIEKFSFDIMNLANKWGEERAGGVAYQRVTEEDIGLIRGAEEHNPDEMIRDMSKEFLKTYDAWKKKQLDKSIAEWSIMEKAVARFDGFIQKLEKAGLVLVPLRKEEQEEVSFHGREEEQEEFGPNEDLPDLEKGNLNTKNVVDEEPGKKEGTPSSTTPLKKSLNFRALRRQIGRRQIGEKENK